VIHLVDDQHLSALVHLSTNSPKLEAALAAEGITLTIG
jgi:hypothetical protein